MLLREKAFRYSIFLIILLFPGVLLSYNMKSRIKSGNYIPGEIVTVESLRFMPVPSTNSNYKIFQSIGKVSNIIIGKFDTVPQEIILIRDSNADGKVDLAVHWMVEEKELIREGNPGSFCSPEKFKEYKDTIFKGDSSIEKIDTLYFLNYLLTHNKNIYRVKNGFRLFYPDRKSSKMERIIYYYSNNGINGFDLQLNVKYFERKSGILQPIISQYVYCKNSRDSFVREIVKNLLERTNKTLGK